ncbi:MAG: hypothetical protein GY931_14650 [Maribacter sp.]|nr:hypothetical protein [Maribacter sp.]
MSKLPFIIYVDVDDTFVRSHGTKRIPIPIVIEHIKSLKAQGATLYCWSSGGSEYAKNSAVEFGILECFESFLPKPMVILDDVELSNWRNLIEIHPNECPNNTIESYKKKISES